MLFFNCTSLVKIYQPSVFYFPWIEKERVKWSLTDVFYFKNSRTGWKQWQKSLVTRYEFFQAQHLSLYLAHCLGQITVQNIICICFTTFSVFMVVVLWHQSMVHPEEDDDFYELQPADYYNLISNRMAGYLYWHLILLENLLILHLTL